MEVAPLLTTLTSFGWLEVGVSTTATVAVLTTAVELLDVVAVGSVSSAVLVGDICAFEKQIYKFCAFIRGF